MKYADLYKKVVYYVDIFNFIFIFCSLFFLRYFNIFKISLCVYNWFILFGISYSNLFWADYYFYDLFYMYNFLQYVTFSHNKYKALMNTVLYLLYKIVSAIHKLWCHSLYIFKDQLICLNHNRLVYTFLLPLSSFVYFYAHLKWS